MRDCEPAGRSSSPSSRGFHDRSGWSWKPRGTGSTPTNVWRGGGGDPAGPPSEDQDDRLCHDQDRPDRRHNPGAPGQGRPRPPGLHPSQGGEGPPRDPAAPGVSGIPPDCCEEPHSLLSLHAGPRASLHGPVWEVRSGLAKGPGDPRTVQESPRPGPQDLREPAAGDQKGHADDRGPCGRGSQGETHPSDPRVGEILRLLILAEIGDVHRFPDEKHLISFAGLCPSTFQSGKVSYHGRLTKQGSKWLRWILVEAAQHYFRAPGRLGDFYRRVERRRGSKVAKVVVAREILACIYHCLKKGVAFDENLGGGQKRLSQHAPTLSGR